MPSSSGSRRSVAAASKTPSSPTTTISLQDHHINGDLPWILHHVLNPIYTPELPLTTMFRFNSGRKPPAAREVFLWWQLDRGGLLMKQMMSSLDTDSSWKQTLSQQQNDFDSARLFMEQMMSSLDVHAHLTQSLSVQQNDLVDLETITEDQSPAHDLDYLLLPHNQQTIRKEVRFAELYPEPLPKTEKDDMVSFEKFFPKKRPDYEISYEKGLPSAIIAKFCLGVVPEDYKKATFQGCLHGLDVIRDLEFTRRAQLRAAGEKWGVNENNWQTYFGSNSVAFTWYKRMEKIETQMQKWFAEIYVGLRIWIMYNMIKTGETINDLFAMLNTLYSPVIHSVPSDEISITQLKWHRKIIFGWILATEADRDLILSIEEILLRGKHSWQKVHLCLNNYFKHATNQRTFAQSIQGTHPSFAPLGPPTPPANPPTLDPIWIEEIDHEEKTPWLSTPNPDTKSNFSLSPSSSEDNIRASCVPAPLFFGGPAPSLAEDTVLSAAPAAPKKKKSFAALRGMLKRKEKKEGDETEIM